MALNAACNERLEKSEYLLSAFVKGVGFLIDISTFNQSIFLLWSGVNHIHQTVKRILRHGAKIKHHLIYAQSSFAAFDNWLEARLVDHTLVEELVNCRKDIYELYYDWAFLRDPTLFNLFVDCLHILGTRDLETFCEIELITTKLVKEVQVLSPAPTPTALQEVMPLEMEKGNSSSPTVIVPEEQHLPKAQEAVEVVVTVAIPSDTDDVSSSSNLSIPNFTYASVSPICSPPQFSHISGFESDYAEGPSVSRSLEAVQVAPSPSVHSLGLPMSPSVQDDDNNSVLSFSRYRSPEIRKPAQSFLESGGFIQPPAMGHFPLPQKGQSVTSFLSSLSDSNYSMPELDRENAHFNVSEALISAFERLKVNRIKEQSLLNSPVTPIPGDMEDLFGTAGPSCSTPLKPENLPEPDTTRTFHSGSRFPRPPVMHTETEESEAEYWRQRPRKPPNHLRKRPRPTTGKLGSDGRSASASVLSTTEVSTPSSSNSTFEEDIASSSFSAENVALNLLRNAKMKDEHLPPASELKWLVSEHEVPQALLPLPKHWTASASEGESDYGAKGDCVGHLDKTMRLRGTVEWAPPRPQIIFTIHPSPSIDILIMTQRYRCAGCGMRVERKYVSTFRYCFYLGRYFCTGCHTGKRARLPQFILHKWDFSPYPVSNFSAQLLESLYSDPVYNCLAINPNLTKKVKLNNFRNYRIQLSFLNEYLKNCKSAQKLYQDYLQFPTYYTADVDLCSLEDLINVRFSMGMPMFLKDFVAEAIRHILHCELCKNLGFICELCNRKEVIFPFQINRVSRCPNCATTFHLRCFNLYSTECPKCLRVTKRRGTLEESPAVVLV